MTISNAERTHGGTRWLYTATAAAVLTSACGESGPAADWTVVRDTLPSGVEQVTNRPPPRAAPTWTLVEEIRVGTVEADRPESFGEIKGLVGLEGWVWTGAMTDDGRILKHSTSTMRVFDSTMTEMPSLALPPAAEDVGDEDPSIFLVESASGWQVRQVPFYPAGATAFDPSGAMWSAAFGDPSHRVHKWMPGGDTVLVAVTERPPLPVTAAERDSVMADVRAWLRERGVETEADWSRIPDVKPAVQGLFTSAEGNLWVRTSSPAGGVAYDVLAPDGAYLGSTAPAPLETVFWLNPVVRGDSYWTVVFDELDVPYVVRARITPT